MSNLFIQTTNISGSTPEQQDESENGSNTGMIAGVCGVVGLVVGVGAGYGAFKISDETKLTFKMNGHNTDYSATLSDLKKAYVQQQIASQGANMIQGITKVSTLPSIPVALAPQIGMTATDIKLVEADIATLIAKLTTCSLKDKTITELKTQWITHEFVKEIAEGLGLKVTKVEQQKSSEAAKSATNATKCETGNSAYDLLIKILKTDKASMSDSGKFNGILKDFNKCGTTHDSHYIIG